MIKATKEEEEEEEQEEEEEEEEEAKKKVETSLDEKCNFDWCVPQKNLFDGLTKNHTHTVLLWCDKWGVFLWGGGGAKKKTWFHSNKCVAYFVLPRIVATKAPPY